MNEAPGGALCSRWFVLLVQMYLVLAPSCRGKEAPSWNIFGGLDTMKDHLVGQMLNEGVRVGVCLEYWRRSAEVVGITCQIELWLVDQMSPPVELPSSLNTMKISVEICWHVSGRNAKRVRWGEPDTRCIYCWVNFCWGNSCTCCTNKIKKYCVGNRPGSVNCYRFKRKAFLISWAFVNASWKHRPMWTHTPKNGTPVENLI